MRYLCTLVVLLGGAAACSTGDESADLRFPVAAESEVDHAEAWMRGRGLTAAQADGLKAALAADPTDDGARL